MQREDEYWNLIDKNGKLCFNQWFYWIQEFDNGFAHIIPVFNDDMYYINSNLELCDYETKEVLDDVVDTDEKETIEALKQEVKELKKSIDLLTKTLQKKQRK